MRPLRLHRCRRSISSWALLACVAVAAVSCGDLPQPELGSPPSTLSSDAAADSPGVDDQRDATVVPNAVAPDSPPRPDGYIAELLAVSDSTVLAGPLDSVVPLGGAFGGISAARVADDYFGGVVVQGTDGRVLWLAGEGGAPVLVNADPDGNPVGRLLDVGFNDGTPEAVLSLGAGVLVRVQLVTGEQQSLTTLGAGRSLVDLSASSGILALTFADEGCGGLLLFTSAGEPIDVESPAAPADCDAPGRPAFDEVAFGPEGDAYVYTEVEYRGDGVEASTTLVGREFSSRSELFRVPVGAAGDRIDSLAFDGRRVLFVRSSLNEEAPTGLTLLEIAAPEILLPISFQSTGEGAITRVAFARRPLSVGSEGP